MIHLTQSILVDSREPEHIFTLLENNKINYKKEFLPVGDFVFGNIVFERKEINDFVSSITSTGRLYNQIENMLVNFEKVYIIISGNLDELFTGGIYREELVFGAIGSFCEKYNIKVLRVENDYQLVMQIAKICQKSTEQKNIHATRIKATDEDVFTMMLCSIPLINIKTAKTILNKYKFNELYNITTEQLAELPLIGIKKAENIKRFLHL